MTLSLKLRDNLKVRPIHHWLENRVRAHIFLCMPVNQRNFSLEGRSVCAHEVFHIFKRDSAGMIDIDLFEIIGDKAKP